MAKLVVWSFVAFMYAAKREILSFEHHNFRLDAAPGGGIIFELP